MKTRNDSDSGLALIKSLIEKMLDIKYIYIVSAFTFVVLAFLYNKYAPKEYELMSTIGPVKDTRSAALASSGMFNSESAPGMKLEEAINALYSFTLVSKTVNELNLEISYFVDSTRLFKQYTEIYKESPFTVTLDKSHIQTIGTKFHVTILSATSYKLTASSKKAYLFNYIDNYVVSEDQTIEIDTICKFNETISSWNYKFSISPNKVLFDKALASRKDFCFELYSPEELVKGLMKKIDIAPVSYMASIINVKYNSRNLRKSVDFVNSFIASFLEENLAKKNRIANSTINFIDKQISEMSDSLSQSESTLKNFRSNTQGMDFSYQGRQMYSQLTEMENEKSNLERQIRYYNYVLNYCKANQDISGITLPSSAKVTDPIMTELIADMVSMYGERSTVSNTGEKNIFLERIDNRIKNQKQTIVESATNNINTLNLTLNELNYKSENLSRDMSSLPQQEMQMVNIQRKFDLNNTFYTYLLQKRSESAIILSSTYPDYEVLEPAREVTAKVTKPKGKMNYVISLFLGFFFPTIFVIIRMFMSDKIGSKYDIEALIERPVIGTIYTNLKKSEAVFTESPNSAIAESFRNLRSSLFLRLKNEKTKIIIISSSQSQEGKSFVSFNLATSIASVGVKTIVVDCDLRRPVMHDKFMIENSAGVSNFLLKTARPDDIIHNTSVENLYFIPAGPILPNPSELISAGALDDLIEYLKTKFEYIIIDTPPLGLVADTIQLMKYSSHIIVIARINYTRKDILTNALVLLESNNINNYEVVVNSLNMERSSYSSYNNYYTKD